MRIGIDVGGTNTDAILIDGTALVAQAKRPTTADVTSGIIDSVNDVIAQAPSSADIQAVMLGTTHFTNALLEHKGLAQTAVLRLALPATSLLPPLIDWPDGLRRAIGGHASMVPGGHEFDGREIAPLGEKAILEAIADMRRNGVGAVAICGVFSPVDPSHEERAAALFRENAPEMRTVLSHEIGRIGILERESAAALNASLLEAAERIIGAIRLALASLGVAAPLFLSQNDGTLMDAGYALRFPVFTISSGPTNSMRGAAFLSGITDGIVVDIGGTSTDVGALVNGFPREASVAVNIAGVRTNFRMPDVLSIALGGGSLVTAAPLTIGPESVGYRIASEALVFGGNRLTATDIAVASGRADIGNRSATEHLGRELVMHAIRAMRQRIEDAIDQVKLKADPVPVVLVGGGSVLIGDSLEGASRVVRPPHAEVANAIGAAIAQVGGQVEKVYSLDEVRRDEALRSAQDDASRQAIVAGANPSTVQVVEVEEVPLTYLPSNAVRIRVKAVGDISWYTSRQS